MIARLVASALLLGSATCAVAQQSAAKSEVPPDFLANLTPEQLEKMAPLPKVIQAPADPDAIPLYGAQTPGNAKSENWADQNGNVTVRNVTRPTLTPVLPDPAKANGSAVIIAPGGGFMALSTESEGFQVARVLADRGIAAFVLKYRLRPTPVSEAEARMFSVRTLVAAMANPADGASSLQTAESTQDGLAAIALVRSNAAKWRIDPKRTGIMGFSAGAMTSLSTALAPDAAVRPSFVGFVYGPQVSVKVPTGAPPLFDAIAVDDQIFKTSGFAIVGDWLAAGRPVELHAYGKGGHGFGGLGTKSTTTTLLLDEFTTWLSMQGFLSPSATH